MIVVRNVKLSTVVGPRKPATEKIRNDSLMLLIAI